MQSFPFPIFLNRLNNIENDFMVEENGIFKDNLFNQIWSSMSKLCGKVWHLYHFTSAVTYGAVHTDRR